MFSYRIVSRVAGVVPAPTRLKAYSVYMQHKKKRDSKNRTSLFLVLRRKDSNLRPLGYEPNELPLLHSAIFLFSGAKIVYFVIQSKLFFINIS